MNVSVQDSTLSSDLWDAYRNNLPRHIIGLTRYLQSSLMRSLIDECGHKDLSLNFEPYISLATGDGIRLSALADALSVSKQAVNQTVNQMENAGYVRRVADNTDGRAKRIVLTDSGRKLSKDGAQKLARVDAEFVAALGDSQVSELRDLLEQLSRTLNLDVANTADRGQAMGALLPRLSDSLMQALMERTRKRGHSGLKMSFGQVLTLMPPEGGRIQQMARINEVSKQAISAIAGELEELGYLERHPDPRDARQLILRFTPLGVRLLEDSIASTGELDAMFRKALGEHQFTRVRILTESLYQELQLETDVFGGSKYIDTLALDLITSLGEDNARHLAMRLIKAVEETK